MTRAAPVAFSTVIAAVLVASMSTAACRSATAPDQGTWGSDQVTLTIDPQNKATLQFLGSGGCYASYGGIEQGNLLTGTFTLPGTYTELTGAAPGTRQYAAVYTGTVAGKQMTLSVSVSALQQTLGPFRLTSGVEKQWPACRFP